MKKIVGLLIIQNKQQVIFSKIKFDKGCRIKVFRCASCPNRDY